MSLLYIVDGYNVINKSRLFKNKKLKEARNALFSYIAQRRLRGSMRNRLIVVFDGTSDILEFKESLAFEVLFTRGYSADEEINKLVSKQANPKNIVVVTDDRGLARSVRAQGAMVISVAEFLNKRMPQIRGRGSSLDGEEPELNIAEREKITRELSRIWLKD